MLRCLPVGIEASPIRRCWLAGHTSAEVEWVQFYRRKRKRQRDVHIRDREEVIRWWILWKGLKNRGLKSTRDNQAMEKRRKAFSPKAESKEVKIKRGIMRLSGKKWQYKHLTARSQVAGGHLMTRPRGVKESSLRVREMSEDWKLKRVENRKQLPWGMQ